MSKQRSSKTVCIPVRCLNRLLTKSILAKEIHDLWKAHFFKGQWNDPLEALETSFKECFFGKQDLSLAEIVENFSYRLVESNITWVCCDIAWALDNQDIVVALDLPGQLLVHFKSWCRELWPETKLQPNVGRSNGFYDHSALLLLKSKQRGEHARKLENIFFTFLRDLNLSYSLSQQPNRKAQGDAFRRFATAFEGILEEVHEKSGPRKDDLCDQLWTLSLNH